MAKNKNQSGQSGQSGEAAPQDETVVTQDAPQDADATTEPLAAVGEKNGKAKKNMKIQTIYLDGEGKETNDILEGRGIKVIMAGQEEILTLSAFPKNILFAAALFGLNTTLRNNHNSTDAAGKDGKQAVLNRIATLKTGEWAARGEGGEAGTPLIIEAMIKAKTDAGQYTDGMEQKWLDQYTSLDKEGKAELTKKWYNFKPVEVAYLTIKAERAAQKARAAAGNGSAEAPALDF